MHHPGQGFVRQQRVIAVDHLVFQFRAGPHGRGFRRRDDALPNTHQNVRIRVAHIVVNLGKVRHDVRRLAAPRDHIVNTRLFRHVFTHQIDHVIHRLDTVQR